MTATATALLGFTAWTLILVVLLGGLRVSLVLGGEKEANGFSPGGDDLTGFGRRLTRAHANCYENLPLAGAVLLYAVATNQTAITDGLAMAFLGARLAQSVIHMISTSRMAVRIRLLFFLIQVGILFFWILALAHLI